MEICHMLANKWPLKWTFTEYKWCGGDIVHLRYFFFVQQRIVMYLIYMDYMVVQHV